MESTLREYNSPRKQSPSFLTVTLRYRYVGFFVANTWQHLPHPPYCSKYKMLTIAGLRSFWPLLPHPSTDRNLPIKFGTNPSTIVLVIVVTDRLTDTQTNAGTTYCLAFAGRITHNSHQHYTRPNYHTQCTARQATHHHKLETLPPVVFAVQQQATRWTTK